MRRISSQTSLIIYDAWLFASLQEKNSETIAFLQPLRFCVSDAFFSISISFFAFSFYSDKKSESELHFVTYGKK
jgi:hypothetical protein